MATSPGTAGPAGGAATVVGPAAAGMSAAPWPVPGSSGSVVLAEPTAAAYPVRELGSSRSGEEVGLRQRGRLPGRVCRPLLRRTGRPRSEAAGVGLALGGEGGF